MKRFEFIILSDVFPLESFHVIAENKEKATRQFIDALDTIKKDENYFVVPFEDTYIVFHNNNQFFLQLEEHKNKRRRMGNKHKRNLKYQGKGKCNKSRP